MLATAERAAQVADGFILIANCLGDDEPAVYVTGSREGSFVILADLTERADVLQVRRWRLFDGAAHDDGTFAGAFYGEEIAK